MASNQVVKDEGKTVIASSQRPDGTWRKERAVKPGFVPQEEVPLYESRGKRFVKQQAEAMPAGLTPEIWEQMKQQQKKNSAGQKKKKNKSKNQASV